MWKHFTSRGEEKVIVEPRASLVTALPATPNDGDEIILTDSLSAGTYQWRLRYVAARSTNKWIYIGGIGAINAVSASESVTGSTAQTAYYDPTTAGPTFTTPVAGLYRIEFVLRGAMNADYHSGSVGLSEGGAAAEDATALKWQPTNSGTGSESLKWILPDRQVSASTALKMMYRAVAFSGTATMTVSYRRIIVTPVALGG